MLDVTQNGNWLCQRDATGDITSKPPLYIWLAALAAVTFGRLNLFTVYLPAALSTLALAWLIYGVGRVYFGGLTALLAGLVYLLSFVSAKQVTLARTDGLFSLMVTVATLLAFRAWRMQRGWTWFWIAVAAATLTKGPLGVVLGAGGLLASVWERHQANPLLWKGSHWLGIVLFVLIAGGWFGLSYVKLGQPLVDKMLRQELAVHAVSNGRGDPPGTGFYKPSVYFLARFAPWSVLACVGFWRVSRRPSSAATQRRFERFLFCWFFVGLFVFSCTPHQCYDLLWPLIPAAALLENTILVVTGDHGEEFGEDGYISHNFAFDDYQIKTTMIMKIPGEASRQVSTLTSHLDIVPTVLELLGCTTPASKYSHGRNLLSTAPRSFVFCSDWDQGAFVTETERVVIPVSSTKVHFIELRTGLDYKLLDGKETLKKFRPAMFDVQKGMADFLR